MAKAKTLDKKAAKEKEVLERKEAKSKPENKAAKSKPADKTVKGARSPILEQIVANGPVIVGKHRSHVITGVTVVKEGKKDGLLITNWTLDGKDVPAKHAKGLVGKTFDTINKAGVACYGSMNAAYDTPKELHGSYLRSLVFGKAPPAPTDLSKNIEAKETSKVAVKAPKVAKKSASVATSAVDKVDKVKRASDTPKRKSTSVIRKIGQEDAPEGKTRWFCTACMAAFFVSSKVKSKNLVCEKGHKQGSIEDASDELNEPTFHEDDDQDLIEDLEEDEDV